MYGNPETFSYPVYILTGVKRASGLLERIETAITRSYLLYEFRPDVNGFYPGMRDVSEFVILSESALPIVLYTNFDTFCAAYAERFPVPPCAP